MDAKFSNKFESKNYQAYLKLLMYSCVPAREDIWLAGYLSAQDNCPINDNPFNELDEEYQIWEHGWWEGFYGDENIAAVLCEDLTNAMSPEPPPSRRPKNR